MIPTTIARTSQSFMTGAVYFLVSQKYTVKCNGKFGRSSLYLNDFLARDIGVLGGMLTIYNQFPGYECKHTHPPYVK